MRIKTILTLGTVLYCKYIYLLVWRIDCMALREVKPLDEKQWSAVRKMMEVGPTKESIQIVQESLKRASAIPKE